MRGTDKIKGKQMIHHGGHIKYVNNQKNKVKQALFLQQPK